MAVKNTDDDELVRQALKANPAALAQLYRRYLDDVYRHVYMRVGTRADAEDLTSEIFLRMVENLHQYRGPGKFRSWLMGIARHVVNDFWRTCYAISEVPLDTWSVRGTTNPICDNNPNKDFENSIVLLMREQLSKLPDHYRRVLELRFLEGKSVRETAQAMGCTESTVKVRQYRALQKLAQGLTGAKDDEFPEVTMVGVDKDE